MNTCGQSQGKTKYGSALFVIFLGVLNLFACFASYKVTENINPLCCQLVFASKPVVLIFTVFLSSHLGPITSVSPEFL